MRIDPQKGVVLPGPMAPSHVDIIEPERCSIVDLQEFHSKEYVSMLERENKRDISIQSSAREEFGLSDDCISFPGQS